MTTEVGTRSCAFCDIVGGRASAAIVLEDATAIAFLDRRPLFPGHTLLVPKQHHVTLDALPADLVGLFFETVQWVSVAVRDAMEADGYFVALNNVVSQSVPHLHAHIVPRRRGDGLRGFFWPRQKYRDEEHTEEVRAAIVRALKMHPSDRGPH